MNTEHNNFRFRSKLYYYAADVTDVYDGDTITVNLNLGLGLWQHGVRIRLWKVDTPEVKGLTRERGLYVAKMVRDLVLGKTVLLRTILDKRGDDRTEKFGRLLGEVLVENERGALINVNDLLLGLGLALPMSEKGAKTRSMAPESQVARPVPSVVSCPFCGEERQVVAQTAVATDEIVHTADEPFSTAEGRGVHYRVVQCPNCLDEARSLSEFADNF